MSHIEFDIEEPFIRTRRWWREFAANDDCTFECPWGEDAMLAYDAARCVARAPFGSGSLYCSFAQDAFQEALTALLDAIGKAGFSFRAEPAPVEASLAAPMPGGAPMGRSSEIISSLSEAKLPVLESEEDENHPVVGRPQGYWKSLYDRHRNCKLREVIQSVLDHDVSLYREILKSYERQSEAVGFVAPEDVGPMQWVLGYDCDDEKVAVVDQSDAADILDDWFEWNALPSVLPNGRSIRGAVKSFDQLLAIMTQINPYWLLEVAAYALCGKDFGRLSPNRAYRYDASPDEIKLIRTDLATLLLSL